MENEKQIAAHEAVKLLGNNMIVGLGTGSTVVYAIEKIAGLVQQGLLIKGVPTSEKTKALARQLQIPLLDFKDVTSTDVTIDGADEFTTGLDLIKGGGGALFREKLVASISKKVIIVTDSSKHVHQLGRFKVPVEVVPQAANYVLQSLKQLGGTGTLRMQDHTRFVTDQGNHIIDADFGLINHPKQLAEQLDTITGILEHGLFINIATHVFMAKGSEVVCFTAL